MNERDLWQRFDHLARDFVELGRRKERTQLDPLVESLERDNRALRSLLESTQRQLEKERALHDGIKSMLRAREDENYRLHQRLVAHHLNSEQTQEQLTQAAQRGDLDTLYSCLSPPMAPDEAEEQSRNCKDHALRIAVSQGFVECIQLLLAQGADPLAKDPLAGRNSIHCAAMSQGEDDRVLCLLFEDSTLVESIDEPDATGMTALGHAAKLCCLERVLFLLTMGANSELVSSTDWKNLEEYQTQKEQLNSSNTTPTTCTGTSTSWDLPFLKQRARNEEAIVAEDRQAQFTPPLACQAKEEQILEETSERARELFSNGNYEEALNLYASLECQGITWSSENRATVCVNAATACAQLNRHSEAIAWCDKALEALPEHSSALIQRAQSNMELFRYVSAKSDFELLALLTHSADQPRWIAWASRAEALDTRTKHNYLLLDVPPSANSSEIRKAFLMQCLKWHPDKNRQTRDDEMRAITMFKLITDANA